MKDPMLIVAVHNTGRYDGEQIWDGDSRMAAHEGLGDTAVGQINSAGKSCQLNRWPPLR